MALDPAKSLTQYGHDAWKTREGLPQDTVQAVAQGPDGYLWLATSVGLVRFDGVRFTLLDKENAGLAHDNVWGLCLARDGTLWIATDGGGVSTLKNGKLSSFSRASGLSNDFVRAIREGPDGTIWMATRGGGVNRLQDGTLTTITTRDGLASDLVWALHADADGGLWLGSNGGGLTWMKDGVFKTFTTKDGLPHNSIWHLGKDRDGALWISTSRGVVRHAGGRFQTFTMKDGLAGDFIRHVHQDRDGNIWIGTTTGLSRLREGKIESFPVGHPLAAEFIRSINEDHEGSLWIGTSAGGLHRLRDGRFTVYGKPEGLSHGLTRAVIETRDGSFWVATDASLNRLQNGRVTDYGASGRLPSSNIATLAEGRDGSVWFGTSGGGLCNLKDERFRCYAVKDGLPANVVPAVLEDSAGRFWAGTASGLARLEGERFVSYTTNDGLPGDFVRTLLEGRDGRIWIGTTGGLASWQDGNITAWTPKEGLGRGGVEALHEDEEGALWVGTRGGGLSRLEGGSIRTLSRRDGLADDVIYTLLGDDRGSLWLSSPRGISRIEIKSLRAFLDGKLPGIPTVSYDASDGMRSSESTPGSPGGWRARDGRLWFSTVRGLVSVHPGETRNNTLAPPVVIEEARADDRSTTNPRDLVVDAGTERLEFRYTGLSFLVPAKVRFRYLLEGFDRDWIPAGTRREAYYTNVPPGRYRFLVAACNNDGVWSEPAAMALTLPPRFRQTWTFVGLCAFGLVLAGAGLYRLRVKHLRLREQALLSLVDERTLDLRRARDELEDRVRERTRELAHAEENYRGIFENAVEGIFQTTPDGRFLAANPALARMLGYDSPGALMAAELNLERKGYVDPGRRAEFKRLLSERGTIEGFESQVYRRDGGTIWISENVRALRDVNGSLYYEGTNEDITKRKLAEARQATQAAITHVLAESGSLEEAAPKLLRLIGDGFGWELGEMWRVDAWAGRLSWAGCWHEPSSWTEQLETASRNTSLAPGEGIAGQAWQAGRPLWTSDIRDEPSSPRTRLVLGMDLKAALAVPITSGGHIPGVLVFMSPDARRPGPEVFAMMADISSRVGQFVQRRQAEESLRHSQTMTAMGSLVAGVAHEVRNPLFAISATLDAFEAEVSADRKHQPQIETLRSELLRLGRLMEELLAFGKPLSELTLEPLADVVTDAVGACRAIASRGNINVTASIDGAVGRISMDRGRLVQVFQNLIQNSIEHSPPGASVSIDGWRIQENGRPWIECAVKDSGSGFHQDDLPRIFEPFFTRRQGGTGLGLSIVQRIVDEHGGQVRVANRPEGGGVVTVRLPARGGEGA